MTTWILKPPFVIAREIVYAEIVCFLEGKECLFAVLRKDKPDISVWHIYGAVAAYLHRDIDGVPLSELMFYHLDTQNVVRWGRHWYPRLRCLRLFYAGPRVLEVYNVVELEPNPCRHLFRKAFRYLRLTYVTEVMERVLSR